MPQKEDGPLRKDKDEILSTNESSIGEKNSLTKGIENNVVLLVDCDVDFVTDVKDRLEEEGFHTIIALNAQKGIELFYTMKPAFVLVNLEIDDNGKDSIEQLIKLVHQSHIPIVLVSEQITLENRVYAYEIGATDFIDKKVIHPEWFVPYLHNRLAYQQRILIDELTGAYNRKYMEQLLDELIADYERNGEPFSIAMIDLDFFKQVNDQYGHLVGDQVLRELVKTINKYKRKSDYLCRFGGEEFQLSLPKSDAVGAKKVLERIREKFSQIPFYADDEEFYVTFSAGVTEIHPYNRSKKILIDEADKALYQSKESGRNCTTIFTKENEVSVLRRMHIIIVDDNRLIRTMLEENFKKWDFDRMVETVVHTYADGVEFLASDWYDPNDKYIILLDGVMPKMDGVAVLTKVREIYPDRDIVISMLSARTKESSIVHALEKGADDYMLKPFKIPEVIARVGRLARRMLF